jgi:flagella basal body P-ring formation protein FlgA
MLLKTFLLIVVFLELLLSNTLNKEYFINSRDIKLSQIIPHAKKDVILFSLEEGKHTKRVKSKDLIKLLKNKGYDSYTSKSNYIQFTKRSPIDISKIKKSIIRFYQKAYKDIEIKQISIMPRNYLESLPKNYVTNIQKKSVLYNHGTLYIKTKQNKKIFFDYNIDASLSVYVAKDDIKRDVELSAINCVKKSIILNRFRDVPIINIYNNTIQTKKPIKSGNVITIRDIQKLSLVKRGSDVTTVLNTEGITLSFSTKAQKDGKLGDTITVKNSNGKKFTVKVIGKNMTEVK